MSHSGGSLFVFDRNVIQHFRQDGYSWMKEANEKLKVGRIDALKCYYAHGEEDQNFQRRSYWMLKELSHLVFVHYLVVKENRTNFKCYRESEVIPDSQKPRENIHNSQVESSVFSEIQPNSYEGTLQVTDPASLDSAHASEFENAELVYCHQQSPGCQSFDNVMQPVVQKMRDGSIPYCDVPISDLKMSFNPAALLASIKQKAKRKDEVDPGEGVRSLELIMLKALSMVRASSVIPKDEAPR
ncbi:unnamed protein product [Fraxinus pennsylvanica]|uniref:CG-1 domain-containing protein n=1 Tax=Fraxinus pennsylvanica TaxID=56036 RepID=A0AAD1YLT3_9LAMI|nr:unnamed protein product [Fraxinus pennsylvanica]